MNCRNSCGRAGMSLILESSSSYTNYTQLLLTKQVEEYQEYWFEPINNLTRPTAHEEISVLVAIFPLGIKTLITWQKQTCSRAAFWSLSQLHSGWVSPPRKGVGDRQVEQKALPGYHQWNSFFIRFIHWDFKQDAICKIGSTAEGNLENIQL